MARQSLIEQLDKAVQAILDKPDPLGPQSDARLAALVRVADELRDLPRPEFKVRLKTELERRTGMANQNAVRSEEHTSELQSRQYLVCRLLLEKKKKKT